MSKGNKWKIDRTLNPLIGAGLLRDEPFSLLEDRPSPGTSLGLAEIAHHDV
jgi:hypothetical protein